MARDELLQKQLDQFRIPSRKHNSDEQLDDDVFLDDDNLDNESCIDEDVEVFMPKIKRLPKELRTIIFALFELDASGKEIPDQWDHPELWKKENAKLVRSRAKLDTISAANRKKIFACFAPKLAKEVEHTWQHLKSSPYRVGYSQRPFRAPKHANGTFDTRIDWLSSFARVIAEFDPGVVTLSWLAQWAPHAFAWSTDCVAPLFASVLSTKSKQSDELFEILRQSATREHEIGIMGAHVIGGLLGSSRKEGWELIEKTLLAAQRQEGLRQSILEGAPLSHPEAFRRLLRLILENNLVRFSSVCRAVNTWFGLLWDSASTKTMVENVESILALLESQAARKKALASDNAETVYRALWAMAYEDAPATVPVAAKLLNHSSDDIRFVATWVLTVIGLDTGLKARSVAIDDENLQVAMLAAVQNTGISVHDDFCQLFAENDSESSDATTFARLERLYARLPVKSTTLKPIVWPWTERKVERSMVATCLLAEIGDQKPTKLIPFLKDFDSWQISSVIDYLAQQKTWDPLTRSTLVDLFGHASSSVRDSAFDRLVKATLTVDERKQIEAYLSRTSADLRLKAIQLLCQGESHHVCESADRLLQDGKKKRRLAGLEMLRQLAESAAEESIKVEKQTKTKTKTKKTQPTQLGPDDVRAFCRSRAEQYRAQRKRISKEEERQLKSIEDADRTRYTADDGFGFLDNDARSPLVTPEPQKRFTAISKASLACLKDLDDLIHKHRKEIVTVRSWDGIKDVPLGEAYSSLPSLNLKKPLRPQRDKFPLIEIWEKWKKGRPAKLKDKDGLELLRATVALEYMYGYESEEIRFWMRKGTNKKLAGNILGEVSAPRLRYEGVLSDIIEWLFFYEIPKGCVDYLLNGVENSYALVPSEWHEKLIPAPGASEDDYDDDENDWRHDEIFCLWSSTLTRFLRRTNIKTTKTQEKRIWQLRRFRDEPVPGAKRMRVDLTEIAQWHNKRLATFDDLTDVLLGQRPNRWGGDYHALATLTDPSAPKEYREIAEQTKGLSEWLDKVRQRVLEIELQRGEAKTVASDVALAFSSYHGVDMLMQIMAALGKHKFKVLRGWRSEARDNRAATLTQLIADTYPRESDTEAQFSKAVNAAIAAGYCDETRLLELAFLAPQWTKYVQAHLKWDGFDEGLYWFLAHMSNWDDSAREAAAEAEGLEDDPEYESYDDYDEFDDDFDDSSEDEPFKKPRPLSAWERLVVERTPLTERDRYEGAVDVAWFHRTWETLGSKRWQGLASAARFSANSTQAKKAQFLADVLLGNTDKKVLVDGIKKRNLKDHVRYLGLLPLAKGTRRSKDLVDRYEVLQAYKKYARGLSGLTKPEAFRALEVGMANLARLAGYRDPLRLEWAMEAESVKDLSKGPISMTKDGVTVTLSLDEAATPKLTVARGDRKLKSVPAATRKKHAAIRDLAARAKELRTKASRIKGSLEEAMCRGDSISGAELMQLMDHAILAPQLSRLVLIGEGILGYPDKRGRALRDFAGHLEPVKKTESLRIAHPHDLLRTKKWAKWQRECFQAERVQPFKQVFRELYVVTKQERTTTQSSRFAGQQINPRQAMALWNSRGWNTRDEVFKTFHDQTLNAEVGFQWNYGTAADVEGLTLETVQFRKRDEFKPTKLSSIPPILFSEVMRDIDLVVSVAHRGEVDPEASASTVEMRANLIAETIALMKIKNVKIKSSHALIDGQHSEYSIHLGSGSVHRIPGGALSILPVHAQHRGRLFLPFADDDPRTAEVLSKVLLLANDGEIQDPRILEQLALRKPSPLKTSKGTKSKSAKKSATRTQRYELTDDKASKFWQIQLVDCEITTTWGRVDSKGRSSTKTYETREKAEAAYEKLVKSKLNKGYVKK